MSSAVIHSAMSRTRNWATLPVLFLAVGPTIARAAATAFLAQGEPKLGGADGALREDHITTDASWGSLLRCFQPVFFVVAGCSIIGPARHTPPTQDVPGPRPDVTRPAER